MMKNKIQTLLLDSVPKSLNVILGMNRWARAKYKIEVENEVWIESKQQKLKPIKNPVILRFHFVFKTNRSRDYDNYVPKFIIDGLRKANILSDDNSSVVSKIELEFSKGEKDATVIEIESLKDD